MDITIVVAGLLVAMFYTVSKNLNTAGADEAHMPENWPPMPLPEETDPEGCDPTGHPQHAGMEKTSAEREQALPASHKAPTKPMEGRRPIGRELRSPQGARRAFIYSEIFGRKYR